MAAWRSNNSIDFGAISQWFEFHIYPSSLSVKAGTTLFEVLASTVCADVCIINYKIICHLGNIQPSGRGHSLLCLRVERNSISCIPIDAIWKPPTRHHQPSEPDALLLVKASKAAGSLGW